jgi:hypothetical protein
MAILKISYSLIENEGQMIDSVFSWFKRECGASVKRIGVDYRGDEEYQIEGNEIPEGDKRIDVVLTMVTQDAFSVNINS